MATIPQVTQAMQTVLTTVADAAARATGFVQRNSKFTGAHFVQTLTFGFLADPHASREQLAQTAAALDVTISPQAIDQRLSEAGAACLEQVLDAAAGSVLCADPVLVPLLARFGGVVVQDTTTISLPTCLAHIWQAPGNQHTAGQAAGIKLGVKLDLLTGHLHGPSLEHASTSDRSTWVQDQPIAPDTLRLADLGFFDLTRLQGISQDGGLFLSRPQVSTAVFTLQGVQLDLVTWLSSFGDATVDEWVLLGARHKLPARLLAVKVPKEVVDQRRRRLREEGKRRGRAPSALQLALAAWTLLVTNVPKERLSVKEALVLARARWQIELLIKLFKSHGQIDEWRSSKPFAILCELYAKLLGLVIQHWVFLVGCWQYPERSLMKAAQTVRAHAMCLATSLGSSERLSEALGVVARCVSVGCRINKRRKAPATFQLLLDLSEAELA